MSKITIKTAQDIVALRESGRICGQVLRQLRDQTVSGMTPKDMSRIAAGLINEFGAEAVLLGYEGYPDVICISVNEQVQHGIPNDRPFQPGDVVNYDLCVGYQGLITDAGITFTVDNKFSPDTQRLLQGTEQALQDGIAMVKAGSHVGDISAAIEQTLKAHKLGIVRELCGHGVGYAVHEEPDVLNYGRAGTGPILQAGMVIAIEPIATLGRANIYQDKDGWTFLTADNSWAAHFEHSVLVTEEGCEVLTA